MEKNLLLSGNKMEGEHYQQVRKFTFSTLNPGIVQQYDF